MDLARWAIETKQPLAHIDSLLKTRYVRTTRSDCMEPLLTHAIQVLHNPNKLRYSSGDGLRRLIECDEIPSPPPWKSATIRLSEIPDEPFTLFYRDINQAIDYLFGNPSYASEMDYAPSRIFEADGRTRVYHEFSTGDAWWEAQVSYRGTNNFKRTCLPNTHPWICSGELLKDQRSFL